MFEAYDEIMNVEQLMDVLGVGKNKIYEILGSGELKGIRIGKQWRITRDALNDFIVSKYVT